jgi:ssDNA-binding Zn-finger/Zn-ribbon topoisomerase 1
MIGKKQDLRRRTVQIGLEEFQVLCDVCGKTAMTFKKGMFLGKLGFVHTGITHEFTLPMEEMPRVFEMLGREAISELHKFLHEKMDIWEGLDAYCPECDKVYCREHMKMEVVMDEEAPSFYDCTYGTCPKGHRRMIDD